MRVAQGQAWSRETVAATSRMATLDFGGRTTMNEASDIGDNDNDLISIPPINVPSKVHKILGEGKSTTQGVQEGPAHTFHSTDSESSWKHELSSVG